MKLDEGDRIVGVAICDERQGRAADHGGGPVHPLPGHRRARVQGPRIGRRARHQARRQATRSSPWPSSAMSRRRRPSAWPMCSQANMHAPRRRRGRGAGRGEPKANGRGGRWRSVARALRRAQRARAVRAHRVGERLRQAHLVLRVPHLRPRRQRHHRHGRQRAQRQAGRLLPGRGERPDHAGHRRAAS